MPTVGVTLRGCAGSIAQAKKMTATPMAAVTPRALRMMQRGPVPRCAYLIPASDLMAFASPADLGDFLAGLFALARETAQRHARLVLTIDRLLMDFGADDFQTSLPSLRLAFTYFTPREKHHMLTTLFESLGLKEARPLAALAVDEATAAEALAFEGRLFEIIGRYGLEGPRE